MDDRFGPSALALCAIAARLLGWRPHEFWAATPAELASCLAAPDASPAVFGRADLERLMKDNPDG